MLASGRMHGLHTGRASVGGQSKLHSSAQGSLLASAHGFRGPDGRKAFLSSRGGEAFLVTRRSHFIGGDLAGFDQAELARITSTDGGLVSFLCPCCRRRARKKKGPAASELTESITVDSRLDSVSSSSGGEESSEWVLLLALAAPLLAGKVADEFSTIFMVRLWGMLGTGKPRPQ